MLEHCKCPQGKNLRRERPAGAFARLPSKYSQGRNFEAKVGQSRVRDLTGQSFVIFGRDDVIELLGDLEEALVETL